MKRDASYINYKFQMKRRKFSFVTLEKPKNKNLKNRRLELWENCISEGDIILDLWAPKLR